MAKKTKPEIDQHQTQCVLQANRIKSLELENDELRIQLNDTRIRAERCEEILSQFNLPLTSSTTYRRMP